MAVATIFPLVDDVPLRFPQYVRSYLRVSQYSGGPIQKNHLPNIFSARSALLDLVFLFPEAFQHTRLPARSIKNFHIRGQVYLPPFDDVNFPLFRCEPRSRTPTQVTYPCAHSAKDLVEIHPRRA